MEQIIKIGTCLPGWMAEKALDAAIDAGYETGSVNFHMKTFDAGFLEELAQKLNAVIDGRDFEITTLGFYLNPVEKEEHFAFLKTVIDSARLFGATHVSTFAGAYNGKPVEEAVPRFGEVFRELAARAEANLSLIHISEPTRPALWRGVPRACRARRGKRRKARHRMLSDGRRLESCYLQHRLHAAGVGADVQ